MTLTPLTPCAACSRHVKTSSPRCPFCGAPTVGDEVELRDVPWRMSRGALAVFSASLTVSGVAHVAPAWPQDSVAVPAYGIAPAPPPVSVTLGVPRVSAPRRLSPAAASRVVNARLAGLRRCFYGVLGYGTPRPISLTVTLTASHAGILDLVVIGVSPPEHVRVCVVNEYRAMTFPIREGAVRVTQTLVARSP